MSLAASDIVHESGPRRAMHRRRVRSGSLRHRSRPRRGWRGSRGCVLAWRPWLRALQRRSRRRGPHRRADVTGRT